MNRGAAVTVLSGFAAIWWIVGVAQAGRGSPMMYAVGIAISGLMIATGWARRGPPASREERKHRGRIVGIASTVEGVAILAAVAVLTKVGRRDLIAPAVAIIVGLHFLPLAHWLPAPVYYLTAALLVAAGMVGAFVQEPPARILTVCIGAAAILWFSCGVVLFRPDPQPSQ